MRRWFSRHPLGTMMNALALATTIPCGAGAQQGDPGWAIGWYNGGSWFSEAYDPGLISGLRLSTPLSPTAAVFLEGAYTSTHENPGPDCQNEICVTRDNPVSALVFGVGFMRDVVDSRNGLGPVLSLGLELTSVRWREDRKDDGLPDVTDFSLGLGAFAAFRMPLIRSAELALEAGSVALPAGGDALFSIQMSWIHTIRVGFSFRP